MDCPAPNLPGGTLIPGGGVTVDYTQADVIAVPTGAPANYAVYNVEFVQPSGGPNYYRASVVLLPFPTW